MIKELLDKSIAMQLMSLNPNVLSGRNCQEI
jgi:hypothetical protein